MTLTDIKEPETADDTVRALSIHEFLDQWTKVIKGENNGNSTCFWDQGMCTGEAVSEKEQEGFLGLWRHSPL